MACLDVDASGALRYPLRQVSGIAAVRAQLLIRLLVIRGEWITDRRRGTQWPTWLGIETNEARPVPEETIRAVVLTQARAVEGVAEVTRLSVRFVGRQLQITGTVRVDSDGETGDLNLAEIVPFGSPGAPRGLLATRGC